MKQLTRIEQLDQRLPGLADTVRVWFNQGIPLRKVTALLFQQYNVSVPRSTVANFRSRRWVREQEEKHRKEILERAFQRASRERALKELGSLAPMPDQQAPSLQPLELETAIGPTDDHSDRHECPEAVTEVLTRLQRSSLTCEKY